MALRCDFQSPTFIAEINKILTQFSSAPKLLDFERKQLIARVDLCRYWVDLALQASVDDPDRQNEIDNLVDKEARADPTFTRYQAELRGLEKSLEAAQAQFRIYTDQAQGWGFERLKALGEKYIYKTQDTVKLDLQANISETQQQLNLLQEQARVRLLEVSDYVRQTLRESLSEKQQELQDRVNVIREYVESFSKAVDQLIEAVTAQEQLLLRHAEFLRLEVNRLCAQFNADEDRPPPQPMVAVPVAQTILQSAQNFVAEVQKLLVGLKVETVWDLNPTETRCNTTATKPTGYQLALAELGNFTFPSMRMLALLDPGTGKSCLLALIEQRLMLSIARILDAGGPPPANFPVLPVPILILVYSAGEFAKYETAQPKGEDFCKYDDWNKLIQVDPPVHKEKDNYIVTVFRLRKTRQIIAVSRVSKMTQKPNLTGYVDAEKQYRMSDLFLGESGIPRAGGLVLVDEAHYMFDSKELVSVLNHTRNYVDNTIIARDISVFLFTGTASANSAKFENTFRMVAYLHALEEQFAFGLSRSDIKEPFGVNDERRRKLFDDYFEVDPEAAGTEEEEGEDVEAEKGQVKEQHGVRWKPGKREEFLAAAQKHVSYLTLEHDRGVYPQQRVTPKLAQIAPGAPPVKPDMSAVIRYLPGADTFQFVEAKRAPGIAPYLQVNVPYDNANKLEARIRGTGGVAAKVNKYGTYFAVSDKLNPSPQTHKAIRAFIRSQPGNKFFIWTPSKHWTWGGMKDFVTRVLEQGLGMKELPALTPELNSLWKTNVKAFVDRAYATILKDKRERYVNLRSRDLRDDKDIYQKYLALDNAPQNKDGAYIRVKNGDYTTREALSMYDNHYGIMVEPPQSASSKMQVEARFKRFCGFKSTKTVADWWTTQVIFVAVPGPAATVTETWQQNNMRLVDKNVSSPSGLLDQALHESALTCKMFNHINQLPECYGETQEVKEFTAEGVPITTRRQFARPCLFSDPEKGVSNVEPRFCVGFVNFDEYGVWDEVVFQLLTETELGVAKADDYQITDNSIPFKLLKAVWETNAPLQPYLDYSTGRPKPEIFLQWLRRAAQLETGAPPDLVMRWFVSLLRTRRDQVDASILDALRAHAQTYVEAFEKAKGLDMRRVAEQARLNVSEKENEARALLDFAQRANTNDIINDARTVVHEYAPALERSQVGVLL
jgi:hypothetical protein